MGPIGLTAERKPSFRLVDVTKAYPGVVANDAVSLDLWAGEVHVLVGENGAGKSTLLGIMYGLTRPDLGYVTVAGRQVDIPSARHARQLGIGLVQQHFSLIPTLTPAENLVLALRGTGYAKRPKDARALLKDLSAKYGLVANPDLPVEALSISQQQRVEVLKSLAGDVRVLALDEPNALLTPDEWDQLCGVLRTLADSGVAVLLVSHNLDDVVRLADRVSVLRGGRIVASRPASGLDVAQVGALMVGEIDSGEPPHNAQEPGPVRLQAIDLEVTDRGVAVVRGVDLELRSGEIVGLAGVEGSGQVELTEAIVGVRTSTRGRILHEGQDVSMTTVRERQRRGFGHVPADRHRSAMIRDLTVAENLLLPVLHERGMSRRGLLARSKIAAKASELIEEFDIRCPGPEALISQLSGGNQQKVVLARELSREPDVLVCCYATRGLDFAATAAVHRRVLEARNSGAAVLYASVDLRELLDFSDRIIVMHQGSVVGDLQRSDATPELLGALMGGRHVA